MTSSQAPEAEALLTLLQLVSRATAAADTRELQFGLVNETHNLLPYRMAVLWLSGQGVTAISGVVAPEANAPLVQWLKQLFEAWPAGEEDVRLATAELPQGVMADAGRWLAPHTVLMPLPPIAGKFAGGRLLLTREQPWSDAELDILQQWLDWWPYVYAARQRGGGGLRGRLASYRPRLFRAWRWWLGAALIGALLMPVRLSVLAPAELVPLRPDILRAPVDGVVESVAVTPNQRVSRGDLLFSFDRIEIGNRIQVASRELDTLRAEYRQQAQQSLLDVQGSGKLVLLKSQLEEKNAELAYLQQLDQRSEVRSPRDGLALFADPLDWVGRPVVTGEKVMLVADEHAVEIEAWLSPADAVSFAADSPVDLYLNADPLHPVRGLLRYVAYEAEVRPDGRYAYRVRASLAPDQAQRRIGLRGTVRLQGEQVSLGYWIVRRPWAALRAWAGW